jgi:hypothetical protein
MYVTGTNNFPVDFANYYLDPISTVDYNFSANQTIFPTEYGNLTLNEQSTKTLDGPIVIQGNLHI